MQQNLKKLVPANNKQSTIQSFYLSQPTYDMTPPLPLSYPKLIHYPLDPARHYTHRFIPAFIHDSKPLLVGSDVGMQLDELMMFAKEYSNKDQIMDEEDQMILNQTMMNVSFNGPNKKEKITNAKTEE